MKTQRKFTSTIVLGFVFFLLAGCAVHQESIGNPEFPYPLTDAKVGDIFHLATGHKLTREQMLDAIGDTRVIFVGETHDNPAAHRLELEVLQGVFRRNPGHATLAMEMFTPSQQPTLDRWSAGELDEKDFLREVGWFENWRMNFAYYRPLLDFCRDNHIPILALNAPKSLVHQVGRTPLDKLPDDVRKKLPELDFSDPYQRALTESIYSGHVKNQTMSAGFLRVQTLWDETMAQNLADYLKNPAGKNQQVVAIAGGNHIRYGFGIPRRLHRRLPISYLLVGSREIEIPKENEAQMMDVDIPQFPMRPWDYLELTRYEKIDSGVKLGVLINDAETGVKIEMVVPGSVGEKAGLHKGDILTRANGTQLKDRFDLLYLLMNLKTGEKLPLVVQRGEEQLDLEADF